MPSFESPAYTWGTSAAERLLKFPCDQLIPQPDDQLFRGVSVSASSQIVFRWLCQLRAAPYSYDWIDNGGRQSPKQLIPGLDELVVGQDVMRIFNLAAFERDRHLTIRVKAGSSAAKTFGDVAASYLIVPRSANTCRLLVKLVANYPRGTRGRLMRALLPWGDLVMMRRQLLNLKSRAEGREPEKTR